MNQLLFMATDRKLAHFKYIDDLLEGIIKLMSTEYIYPVNIGNPNEITVKKLADVLIDLTGSTSELIYKHYPLDDSTNRNPDITLAKKNLKLVTNCRFDYRFN